jgi:hypothetical protein
MSLWRLGILPFGAMPKHLPKVLSLFTFYS